MRLFAVESNVKQAAKLDVDDDVILVGVAGGDLLCRWFADFDRSDAWIAVFSLFVQNSRLLRRRSDARRTFCSGDMEYGKENLIYSAIRISWSLVVSIILQIQVHDGVKKSCQRLRAIWACEVKVERRGRRDALMDVCSRNCEKANSRTACIEAVLCLLYYNQCHHQICVVLHTTKTVEKSHDTVDSLEPVRCRVAVEHCHQFSRWMPNSKMYLCPNAQKSPMSRTTTWFVRSFKTFDLIGREHPLWKLILTRRIRTRKDVSTWFLS